MTCKDCIHYDVCEDYKRNICTECNGRHEKFCMNYGICGYFESKSQYIELPCKVGDTVYSTKGHFYLPYVTKFRENDIIPCEVIGIKKVKKGEFMLLKPLVEGTLNKRSANKWFPFTAIGKTVFFKSEAAQKLKEL